MVFPFLIFFVIVIGMIALSIHQSKKADATWAQVSRKLGLHYQAGSLMQDRYMAGTIDGFGVAVQTITRGSGKNSSKYTMYRISYPQPLAVIFSVSRQGFMSGLTKAFGAQDIEVGDLLFDNLVVIKGQQEPRVISFLTPERRRAIQSNMPLLDNLAIDHMAIHSETRGLQSQETVMIQTIQRMVELARVMVGSEAIDAAKSPEPLLMRKTTLAPPAVSPVPPPLSPAGPEPMPAMEAKPTIVIDVASSPLSEPQASPVAIPSLTEIAETLFHHSMIFSEIDKKFASDYKDLQVSGRGILRSWTKSSFDFVFGSGNCIKAKIELPSATSPLNHRGSYQVWVKLPSDAVSRPIGEEITLIGKLIKVDSFTKQLYLDATAPS